MVMSWLALSRLVQATVVPTCTFSAAGANLRSFICTLAVVCILVVDWACFWVWALRAGHCLLSITIDTARASKPSQAAQPLKLLDTGRLGDFIPQTPLLRSGV